MPAFGSCFRNPQICKILIVIESDNLPGRIFCDLVPENQPNEKRIHLTFRPNAHDQHSSIGTSNTTYKCTAQIFVFVWLTERVVSNLGLSIVQRSEAYSDVTLRAVFRLNNYKYLLTTLLTSNLMATLEIVEPSAKQNYSDLILQQKKIYSQR